MTATRRLAAVIEASPDPIVVFDEDATVELWNPAAEAVFGYTEAEVLGERFPSLPIVPPEEVEPFEARLERAFEGETFAGVEVERRTRSGETLTLSLSKAPVREADGTVSGVVTVKKDISRQKRLEERLREENERLDEFTALVSHDLRNPLTVAMGHLEVAQREHDSEHLAAAQRALDRIDALVDDRLAFAHEGDQAIDPGPVDLGETAERCWEHVATRAATLTVDSDCRLLADRTRLQQLLENLFRNAVEHGGDDVTVTVGGIDGGAGFYVADDGRGISPDERDAVFESGYTTSERGTGFGLAIVEQVAAAHGWEVRVTRGADGGARVECTGVERAR